MNPLLEHMLAAQDQLITRQQALRFMTQSQVTAKLGRFWRVVLPGVYAAFTGAMTERQTLRAALLHAGERSVVNDASALRAYGLPFLPRDCSCRVLVPSDVQRLTREFVVIRRTTRMPAASFVRGLPVVPITRALCEFGARHEDERECFAVIAAAVQRRRVSVGELIREVEGAPNRGRPRLVRIVGQLHEGLRSAPERDFRELVASSDILPMPLWNCLVRLPDGRCFSPDALWPTAGLIHETNGRQFHAEASAGLDAFEDMQRRNDRLVAPGLTVLHNTPRRISAEGAAVLHEVEQCFVRLDGQGLPAGVTIERLSPS